MSLAVYSGLAQPRSQAYLCAMGFYATDTLETAPPPRMDPLRARQHPVCGQKPLRGPIHNAISGYRLYNPELGRWLNRDPIEEEGGVNVYSFLRSLCVNDIDVIGLWSLNFRGSWSAGERDLVESAFDLLKSTMPAYRARLDQWIMAASQLPDDCAFKTRLRQELTALHAIFRIMQNGLNSSTPLNIYKRNLGSGTDAKVGMPWSNPPWNLGNTFNGKMYFNTNESKPFSGWSSGYMLQIVFHELSHVAGVPGDDNSTGWYTDNAHNLNSMAGNLNGYTLVPLVSFLMFTVGLGDTCCPKLYEWIPSP